MVFIIPDTFLNLHMHTGLRKYLLAHTKIKEIALFPSSFFPNVNFGYSNLSIITLEKSQDEMSCLDNQFRILTGFKNVEDLRKTESCGKIYKFSQKEVYSHVDHAFFISNNAVNVLLNSSKLRIGDIADCVTGIYSGNDKKYLRSASLEAKNSKKYALVEKDLICHDYASRKDILNGIDSPTCFIPIMKGGAIKYIKQDIWYLDWSKEAVKAYKSDKKARFQNAQYYFKDGIGIPMVSASQVTAALIENRLFDQSIVGVFPKDPRWIFYLLAFFNSPTCNKLLRTINPSANNSANYIKKIPFIAPDEEALEMVNKKIKGIISTIKEKKKYLVNDEIFINNVIEEIYGF